ncbi:hypothetical protein C2E23DRAFT_882398 [Lenzites betulinus]|nr:hypothetical protein C2E23DRAFT_882398 [Lenzites betulinus]
MAPPADTASNGVSLANLHLNDHGLRNLRLFLGRDDIYRRYQDRFDAADLAWFVAGMHKDNDHQVFPNTFHPAWKTAFLVDAPSPEEAKKKRNELRSKLKALLFDTATALDRTQGGCTLVLHVDGPIAPGQRAELENVKVDVVLPPHVLAEVPHIERAIAQIVQQYVESLGIFAVQRWRMAFLNTGRTLNTPISDERRTHSVVRPFMPSPTPSQNHYICYGRPVGQLQEMLDAVGHPKPARPSPAAANPSPEVVEAANAQIHNNAGDDSDDNGPEHGQKEAMLENYIADLEEELQIKDKCIDDRDENLKQMGQTIEEKATIIEEKDAIIEAKERELVARDLVLADRARQLAEMSHLLHAREEDLKQLRARLLSPTPVFANARTFEPAADVPFDVPPTPTPSVMTPPRARVGTPVPLRSHGSGMILSPSALRGGNAVFRSAVDSDDDRSTHSSSMLSHSDWSGTISPTPVGAVSSSEWEMPSYPLVQTRPRVIPQATTTPAGPAPLGRLTRLTRFSALGEHTANAVRDLGLLPALHRHLNALVENVPDNDWVSTLVNHHGLSDSAAEKIRDAMFRDIPTM